MRTHDSKIDALNLIQRVRASPVYSRDSDLMSPPEKVHITENDVHRGIGDASVGGCDPKNDDEQLYRSKNICVHTIEPKAAKSCGERHWGRDNASTTTLCTPLT